MPQDAFHIRRTTAELNALLTGGKINRVSQADKDELTLIIYTGKATVKLVLSTNASNARVCLSKTEKEPAPVAPNFCMLCRKHLQNAEILYVRQYGYERIVEIGLLCTSDFSRSERVLRIEVMGKYSNIVLTEKDVILGALKTASLEDNARRLLFAGAKYAYPDPQEKLSPFSGREIDERLNSRFRFEEADDETLACFLFETVAGYALPTARELVRLWRERGETTTLGTFCGEFFEHEPCEAYLLEANDVPRDFFAFPVRSGRRVSSLCAAQDEYYGFKETGKAFADKKRKLESAVRAYRKKRQKKLADVFERLEECERMEENRVKGELLTGNLYRIPKGEKAVTLENWYASDGGEVKIALDPTLTPAQNAQRYFKAYAKQKRAKEFLEPMKKEEEAALFHADGIAATIALAERADDLKEIETELIEAGLLRAPKAKIGGKKRETVIPFREYEFAGFRVYCGRNNLQNDRLIKAAAPTDEWLHAQKYHSAHVVIAAEGRKIPDDVLLFAAEICAYYSDGRDGGKVPVDHCKRKYVKKPSKAPAGFVTYTDYKTVLVEPRRHEEK